MGTRYACLTLWNLGLAAAMAAEETARKPADGKPAKTKLEISQELPVDAKADAALLKLGGKGAKLRHTPHYAIVHNTDDATLKSFINRIEVTYKSVLQFAHRAGVAVKEPKAKLQILFFEQFDEYVAYGRRHKFEPLETTPGVYFQTTNRSAFYNYSNGPSRLAERKNLDSVRQQKGQERQAGSPIDLSGVANAEARMAKEDERINRSIVQHEVAHQVLFNMGVHKFMVMNPSWLVEGLAMMFETPPSGSGSGFGAVNQYRLLVWTSLRREEKLLDWKRIVSDHSLTHTPDFQTAAYAQSWGLVHYLQRRKPKQFVAYVDAIRQRKQKTEVTPEQEIKLFEKHFGPLDDEFVEKLETFLTKLPFRPRDAF